MTNSNTLHILPASSRNTTRLLQFMEAIKFDKEQNFLVYGKIVNRVAHGSTQFNREFISGRLTSFFRKVKLFINSEKIIVHGFFNVNLVIYLLLLPFLLKKVYWVVWGGDLYRLLEKPKSSSLRSSIRCWLFRRALARVNYVLTYIRGDFELVRKHLNPKAEMIFSLMYPGNLYKPINKSQTQIDTTSINVLVGNSGAPSNNHIRIFKKLSNNKSVRNIRVYCPLSYGNEEYIAHVCSEGRRYFGCNFFPLTEYMDLAEYVRFLSEIRYAIFDYDRQQGMGNIISLLGLGKGVFLNPNTTPWTLFQEQGIEVLNISEIEKYSLETEFLSENPEKVKKFFSSSNLQHQLKECFD